MVLVRWGLVACFLRSRLLACCMLAQPLGRVSLVYKCMYMHMYTLLLFSVGIREEERFGAYIAASVALR